MNKRRMDRIRQAAAGLTALALTLAAPPSLSAAPADAPPPAVAVPSAAQSTAKPQQALTPQHSSTQTQEAATARKPAAQIYAERKALFDQVSILTGIPWYHLAAIDQYERSINQVKRRPTGPGLTAIYMSEAEWGGPLNPNLSDTDPRSIALFGGKGTDGNGDGKADRLNDQDQLQTMTQHLLRYGVSSNRFEQGLLEYYKNTRAVERIMQFSKVYAAFGTLDLHEHAFPLPLNSDYSYRDTWGAKRGWGGKRIHEGTDIFAGHGVSVRSTCFGVVEVMGWNAYGGWRVGIRDLSNVYHYYAHLSGFNKKIKAGDIVKPGQVIGWVGSSGYGKPGTSGKFPPHLHYGLYRDTGTQEWSFDPYPSLKRWEREERIAASRKKKPGGG